MFGFHSIRSDVAIVPALVDEATIAQDDVAVASTAAAVPRDDEHDSEISDRSSISKELNIVGHIHQNNNNNSNDIVVVDGSLEYDNVPTAQSKRSSFDDDEMSLHTAASQESIDINMIYDALDHQDGSTPEESQEDVDLSMRASQVDSDVDAQLSLSSPEEAEEKKATAACNNPESPLSASQIHDLDVLVNVGSSLLREDEVNSSTTVPVPPVETKTSSSWGLVFRISMLVAGLAYVLNAFDITVCDGNIAAETVLEDIITEVPPTLAPFSFEEWRQEDAPVLAPSPEQEDHASDEYSNNNINMMEAFGLTLKMVSAMSFLVLLSLSKSSKTPDDASSDDSVTTTPEATNDDGEIQNEEVPSTPTTKVKQENNIAAAIQSFDLSKYEELKVVELRALLRNKKCKTIGRKHILIQRLVLLYKMELETLTVKQLRPILKSKKLKQSGLKAEIIQRLVEAGM